MPVKELDVFERYIEMISKKICFIFLIFYNMYAEANNGLSDIKLGDNKDKNSGGFLDQTVANALIKEGAYGMSGFTNFGSGNIYYVLIRNSIVELDLANHKLLSVEKLEPYKDHLFLSGEYLAASEVIAADQGEDFSRSSDPLSVISTRKPTYVIFDDAANNTVGCLEKAPLRYVDISGKPELLFVLGKNLVFFSTAFKKVSFSMHYYQSDEWSWDEVESEGVKHDQPIDPQYLAGSSYDALRLGKGGLFPAWRSFGKIYAGSFSGEDARDIVLWRKLYQSRLNKDPIKGFEKLGDVFAHYKLINGEYQKQSTEQSVVKGWLEAKNLTWQNGYPSKSECPGHEGQLIPEMHDPLLNDPDVLK